MAFNTPFKMWKRYEFNGGTSDPCIVAWPAGIQARVETREQYHHAIDLVPTILDAFGIAPRHHRRTSADPLRRRQHAPQLRQRAAAERARDAVLLHARLAEHLARRLEGRHQHPTISAWGDFGKDTWELYHTDVDRSELHDLAAEEPQRLQELINLWYAEAGANGAYPGVADVPESQAANIRNRSYVVAAVADIDGPGAQGVLFAHGSRFGGHALYVKDDRLHYVYSFVGSLEQRIVADLVLPTGEALLLSATFEKDGEDPPGVAVGTLSLFHGDTQVGEGRIRTQPGKFSIAGDGVCVGRDSSDPVTGDYPGRAPWAFTGGTIRTVAIDVTGLPYVDLEREAAAMMARE